MWKCVSYLRIINNRDSTMAALLFAIVLVFFVCHAPKAVINIYEVKTHMRRQPIWIG